MKRLEVAIVPVGVYPFYVLHLPLRREYAVDPVIFFLLLQIP